MFGFASPQEMMFVILLIILMWATGLWPVVIRGIRELRGERLEEPSRERRPQTMDLDLCFKLLGVSPSAPMDEIEKAYRRKAKIHHPDHGGDEDTMRALNDAFAQIKKLRRP